jgi:hypothetical protein
VADALRASGIWKCHERNTSRRIEFFIFIYGSCAHLRMKRRTWEPGKRHLLAVLGVKIKERADGKETEVCTCYARPSSAV